MASGAATGHAAVQGLCYICPPMERVEYLVIGAGVTGLSFANWMRAGHSARGRAAPSMQVLDKEAEPGGYLRSVKQDGFIWDYSGHFFHFRDKGIEQWMRDRLPQGALLEVEKQSVIRYGGRDIDFPFQKNIHQLPESEFAECLADLDTREADFGAGPAGNFEQLLYKHYGRGITDRFLLPYNRKVYATDLLRLDTDAMQRFFPHASREQILENARNPDNRSYNSTFLYPRQGAEVYVGALLRDLPRDLLALGECALAVDTEAKIVRTNRREIGYGTLISSMPLPRLLALSGIEHDRSAFTWSKCLVFNLGFDKKGPERVHWIYFPSPERRFYRVGFYDNIFDEARMSLYVEIGLPASASVSVDEELRRVLAELQAESIVTGQKLVSSHSVVLDPAYVHQTPAGRKEVARLLPILHARGVHTAGRYGAWTYCSIEDNMLETREIATSLIESPRS